MVDPMASKLVENLAVLKGLWLADWLVIVTDVN
jgi:hypothetical protein